ncbi:MAG: hypothetical protein IT422_04090 [Pirellulaceae bacterium]|nr:hypothetical protein [Pirellulaceae bacterium]
MISSRSQAQSIPARSPPAAAIGRENDTKWATRSTKKLCYRPGKLAGESHVADTRKSWGGHVKADWPKDLTTSATAQVHAI